MSDASPMRLLRGRIEPGTFTGSVVTIGKFDGLHRGHRALLARTGEQASLLTLPAVLLSFEPLPPEFFSRAKPRLSSFAQKWRLLADTAAIATLACLRFDHALAALSAEDFVNATLVAGLRARAVLVGEGFRFGNERRGDVALLQRMGRRCGFQVHPLAPIVDEGGRISSSRVRTALEDNRLGEAARLLGRPYRICGQVRAGEQLGRRLGFATANLALGRRPPPLAGIYVVRVTGLADGVRHGMASVGERPTVDGRRRLLEVHFPDFSAALYGRLLTVEFLHWLRNEQRYANLERLSAAIAEDVAAGGRWLAAQGLGWAAS